MLVVTKKYGDIIKVGEAYIRVEKHKKGSNQVTFFIQAPIETKIEGKPLVAPSKTSLMAPLKGV
jgi:sRNA-binding carbon storage regulator CsrA